MAATPDQNLTNEEKGEKGEKRLQKLLGGHGDWVVPLDAATDEPLLIEGPDGELLRCPDLLAIPSMDLHEAKYREYASQWTTESGNTDPRLYINKLRWDDYETIARNLGTLHLSIYVEEESTWYVQEVTNLDPDDDGHVEGSPVYWFSVEQFNTLF